ncbi:hypothetical protein KC874_04580 [Candidatus Saccharibacteria bacterium]|nr:hypothetical protein [Candidatus Saccharibacteria bacterium]
MDKKLQDFINWLESDLTHFAALVEEGSVATDDPKQDGYSDHDLQFVVYKDVKNEMYAVRNWLEQNPLGNKYLLGPRLFDDYLVGDSLNDLSLKFRARTIAGRDVVSEKKAPKREVAIEIGYKGLNNLIPRLERRWLNLAHWTDDYSRHKNYEIYKNFFIYYAALHYGRTGGYPVSRADVAAVIDNKQWANDVLTVTHNIAHATKEQQKTAIESATKIINNI